MTRRAFSVYRSNTISSLLPLGLSPQRFARCESAEHHVRVPRPGRTVPTAPSCASRSTTLGDASDAAAPSTQTQPKRSARPDLRWVHRPVARAALLSAHAQLPLAAVPRPKALPRGVRPGPADLPPPATCALPLALLPAALRALAAASLHFLPP